MNPSSMQSLPWMFRCLATIIPCATLPLIFVGGLVTSTDAGMAVPDWPGTYGYNMFLYPWQTWFYGPWDIFVEHGHRLLGAALGLLSIAICVFAYIYTSYSKLFWLTVFTLFMVCVQGLLGGLRVRMDARYLALIHGCTGPLVFALTMVQLELVKYQFSPVMEHKATSLLTYVWLGTLLFSAAYVQLCLGAVLRHGTELGITHHDFRWFTSLHLTGAAIVLALTLVLTMLHLNAETAVSGKLPYWLAICIVAQILLGIGTWLMNYGWPWGYEDLPEFMQTWIGPTVNARSFAQVIFTTGHVAVGSLILGLSARFATRAWREHQAWQMLSATSLKMRATA